MPKPTGKHIVPDKTPLYALVRFIISVAAVVILASADLKSADGNIPTVVYLLIGALNGVDIYNLIKNIKPDGK